MYKKYMKHIVSLLLALCLVVTAVLGNIGGAGLLQADAAETDTGLTELTFSSFGIADDRLGGLSATCSTVSSLIDTVFRGYVQWESTDNNPWLIFGTNGWSGLQFQFSKDGTSVFISAASWAQEGFGNGDTVTATQVGLTSGSFVGEKFLLTVSLASTEKDANDVTTKMQLKIWFDDTLCVERELTSPNTANLNAAIQTVQNNYLNVWSYVAEEEPEVPEVVTKQRKITFADFKIADGVFNGIYAYNTGKDKGETSLIDSEFSGHIKIADGKSPWLVFGASGGWAGLQFIFSETTLDINTGSVATDNATDFIFRASNCGLTAFDDTEFKLTFSLVSTDLDNKAETVDLLLQVYINDELCVADATADATKYGADGTYYIRNAKTASLQGYVAEPNYSGDVTVRSSQPGDEFEQLTFADFGVGNQSFSGTSTSGTYPGKLEYTELRGHITFTGGAQSGFNYGATTTTNTDFGGMHFFYLGNGQIQVFPSTRLGGKWLNEYDGGTDNATVFSDSGKNYDFDSANGFDLSITAEPWDYQGNGMIDGKIGIRINGEILGGAFIIIENMFAETTTLVSKFALIGGGNFATAGATVSIASEISNLDSLRKVTLEDVGLTSGTYTSMGYKGTGPQTLLNTMIEMNLTVNGTGSDYTWIQYAVPASLGEWNGVRLIVGSKRITVASTQSMFDSFDIPISTIKDATSFLNTPFKMGISIERVDLERDGINDDVRFGFWMDGNIYKYVYGVNMANSVGTGMSIMPAANGEGNTITISQPTEDASDFETIGLSDMTTAAVASGVYNSTSEGGLKVINGKKDGNLDGKIFATNIRFTDEFSQLFYGCSTENEWYAIKIGSNGGNPTKFTLQSSFSDALVGTSETGVGCDVAVKEISMGTAGVRLFDNAFALGISTRNVDCDGDDVFDDVELGLWFEGKLYNNAYFYLPNIAGYIKPNLAVYTWQGGKTANEGQIILGDYTQQTPTEVVYCADDYIYAITGKKVVTVNEQNHETSWSTDIPGEYQIVYTEKNSTFKENVLVYKTNDVTADGVVNVVDLIALKKLAAGQRSNTTPAGKKAVSYVEGSDWYTAEVQGAMYEKLLADANTIQAKVMSDEILGATGSETPAGNATYITSLGATKQGTSVIGISDVADAASRTYTTNMDTFDGSGLDFVLDFDTDRDIKVLQITDTQIIDSKQCRTEDPLERLSADQIAAWDPEQMDNALFDELKALVEKETPDLIVMTGDNVYGEFDDEGTSLKKLIEVMDGFKIPWAPIFGNHDNESAYGVAEQCRMFVEDSTYCLFNRRNEIGGNGNYAIGISVQGKLQRTIFMMDSNGCSNLEGVANPADKDAVTTNMVFHDEQMAWYQTVAAQVNEKAGEKIPSFLCVHIPLAEVTTALVETGYQAKADATVNGVNISHNYTIGNIEADGTAWTYTKDTNNNFGFKEARTVGSAAMSEYILPYLKAAGTDGTFFGHQHVNALSVEWEGIRFTYGLKTGRYDESPNQTGGTVITLKGSEFDVNHAIINNLDAE